MLGVDVYSLLLKLPQLLSLFLPWITFLNLFKPRLTFVLMNMIRPTGLIAFGSLRFYPVLCFSLVLLFGCSRPPEEASNIVKIGDAALTADELTALVLQHPSSDSLFSARQAIKRWLARELLYRAAVDEMLTENPMIEKQSDDFRKQRYGAAFLDTYISSSTETNVSPEELRNHYIKNRDQYRRQSEAVRLLHFLLPQESLALDVKSKLLQYRGESRHELLTGYRVEVATVSPKDLREEIRSVIFSSKGGTGVFGPISDGHGYHVLEVLARYRAHSLRGLDEVYDEVAQSVLREKTAALYSHLMDSLTGQHLSGSSLGFNLDWSTR